MLTEVLRTGAQRLLAQDLEAHLAAHKHLVDDRHRTDFGARATRQGSHPRRGSRAHPVPLLALAPVPAADPLAGAAPALAVPERDLHGGLRGGPAGLAGTRRSWPLLQHDQPSEGGLVSNLSLTRGIACGLIRRPGSGILS